ncbi:hypothetical protein DNU06_01745 [Putridiphycobacter roseus]|uniref:ComEC family competence protein n=1 Tax=Putridiphycobacter roseus TaxID=2219161 RepID=A0A2W1N1S4_9FLAO|nr:ComEC/Rec2 family competence protein [Putridiphycobacter roseus]PZE18579.1 hypothetical protein DNU06_01745 [Putridiphycobacter roseus]
MKAPKILIMCIPFCFGIVFSFYYNDYTIQNTALYLTLLLFLVLLLLLPLRFRNTILFGIIAITTFCSLGFLNGSAHQSISTNPYFFHKKSPYFLVKIIEKPIQKKNSIKLIVEVLQNDSMAKQGQALLYLKNGDKSNMLNYGDWLLIKNKFQPIKPNGNPYEFDYARYLKIHNLYHQSFLKTQEWKLYARAKPSLFGRILKIRNYFEKLIDNSTLFPKNKSIAKALFLGEKEALDKDILRSFSSAGAMHVLAVSGLHVGIIMLILTSLLKPIKRLKHGNIVYTALIISGVWLYALLTGGSPSVIRSALMFSFIIFNVGLERESSVYQSILISAFLILIFDPFALFKVGFQLSYLAVLGIVFLQPRIYRLWYIQNKSLDYLWQITAVSIAAQIATFPLGLYYFHQFPSLFFISNIIVIPLAFILLFLGFFYFSLHLITPIKLLLEEILNFLFYVLSQSMAFIEQIPNAIAWGISISWQETMTIYFCIISLIFALKNKHFPALLASMIGVIILISLSLIEKQQISNENKCIVYNLKNDFAMDVFFGNKNYFISTNSLSQNESKLLFNVKHNWYHYRGDASPYQNIRIDTLSNPVFKTNQKTWQIINHKISTLRATDYLVLISKQYIPKESIDFWKREKCTVILHPNLSRKMKKWIQLNMPENLTYDMAKQGAFSKSF